MLLSVILPTFNSGALLASTLERLYLHPISYAMEVLVLDNCSSDGSTEVLSHYADRDLRLIVEADRGVYDAMNKGIQQARGEWLYFLGAGDLFFPERILAADFSAKADLIYGEVEQNPSPLQGPVTLSQVLDHNICHQGIFYRKAIFRRYSGYELEYRILADHILNIRLFYDSTVRKQYLPITIARYLGGGMSHTQHDPYFRSHKKKVILQACLSNPSFLAWLTTGVYFTRILGRTIQLGRS